MFDPKLFLVSRQKMTYGSDSLTCKRPLPYLSSKSRTTEDAITVTYEQTWQTTALFLQFFGNQKGSWAENFVIQSCHSSCVPQKKIGTYRFGSLWGWVNYDRSLFLGAVSLKSEQLEQMQMMHLTSTSSCWYTVFLLLLFFQCCRSSWADSSEFAYFEWVSNPVKANVM